MKESYEVTKYKLSLALALVVLRHKPQFLSTSEYLSACASKLKDRSEFWRTKYEAKAMEVISLQEQLSEIAGAGQDQGSVETSFEMLKPCKKSWFPFKADEDLSQDGRTFIYAVLSVLRGIPVESSGLQYLWSHELADLCNVLFSSFEVLLQGKTLKHRSVMRFCSMLHSTLLGVFRLAEANLLLEDAQEPCSEIKDCPLIYKLSILLSHLLIEHVEGLNSIAYTKYFVEHLHSSIRLCSMSQKLRVFRHICQELCKHQANSLMNSLIPGKSTSTCLPWSYMLNVLRAIDEEVALSMMDRTALTRMVRSIIKKPILSLNRSALESGSVRLHYLILSVEWQMLGSH